MDHLKNFLNLSAFILGLALFVLAVEIAFFLMSYGIYLILPEQFLRRAMTLKEHREKLQQKTPAEQPHKTENDHTPIGPSEYPENKKGKQS